MGRAARTGDLRVVKFKRLSPQKCRYLAADSSCGGTKRQILTTTCCFSSISRTAHGAGRTVSRDALSRAGPRHYNRSLGVGIRYLTFPLRLHLNSHWVCLTNPMAASSASLSKAASTKVGRRRAPVRHPSGLCPVAIGGGRRRLLD